MMGLGRRSPQPGPTDPRPDSRPRAAAVEPLSIRRPGGPPAPKARNHARRLERLLLPAQPPGSAPPQRVRSGGRGFARRAAPDVAAAAAPNPFPTLDWLPQPGLAPGWV